MAENAAGAQQALRKEKKALDPRIAFAIMLIMLCCSLCMGANKAWRKNRAGVDASYAIWQENVQQRVETAYNLLTVARRYLAEDHALVTAVKMDLKDMENGGTDAFSLRAAASERFVADANALLGALASNAEVARDSRDIMYVTLMLPQAVEQCGNNAAQSAYNDAASSYNSAMHSFSGLLARLTGVPYAQLLGEPGAKGAE